MSWSAASTVTRVVDVTACRAPQALHPTQPRQVSETAKRYIAEAARALYTDEPGLTPEQALAERERYRIEQDAKESQQGVLPLGPAI